MGFATTEAAMDARPTLKTLLDHLSQDHDRIEKALCELNERLAPVLDMGPIAENAVRGADCPPSGPSDCELRAALERAVARARGLESAVHALCRRVDL